MKILLSVDIQPEYYYKSSKYGGFRDEILKGFIKSLNSKKYHKKIVLYNGYDTLGMINENDYRGWIIDNGLRNENNITFYDKGYAFFRFCIDSGISENNIVAIVKYMYENDISDSRDIKDTNSWDDFIEKYNKSEIRELLEDAGDCIHIPDLMRVLEDLKGDDIDLIGGGRGECLKEVEIALMALNIPYKRIENLIYEEGE
jgi:hypothetical protein